MRRRRHPYACPKTPDAGGRIGLNCYGSGWVALSCLPFCLRRAPGPFPAVIIALSLSTGIDDEVLTVCSAAMMPPGFRSDIGGKSRLNDR